LANERPAAAVFSHRLDVSAERLKAEPSKLQVINAGMFLQIERRGEVIIGCRRLSEKSWRSEATVKLQKSHRRLFAETRKIKPVMWTNTTTSG
jgi:hypothetical protein